MSAKLFSRIEAIFKFRLMSNSDINNYLKKMSYMGKIDDVAKIALFTLILTVLGEMEDKEETNLQMLAVGPGELPKEVLNPISLPTEYPDNSISTTPVEKEVVDITFKCPDCDFIAKSKFGLSSHTRHCKHKKVV